MLFALSPLGRIFGLHLGLVFHLHVKNRNFSHTSLIDHESHRIYLRLKTMRGPPGPSPAVFTIQYQIIKKIYILSFYGKI